MLRDGHVSKAGTGSRRRTEERTGSETKIIQTKARVKKKRIVDRDPAAGKPPTVVGGQRPPVQMTNDGVPFARRRAYGLRALEF